VGGIQCHATQIGQMNGALELIAKVTVMGL